MGASDEQADSLYEPPRSGVLIVDNNMHWMPETLFEDEDLMNEFLRTAPKNQGVFAKLDVIPGSVPNLVNLPPGCRFAPRCRSREKFGLGICGKVEPELVEVMPGHTVRCWLYLDHEAEGHEAPLKPENVTREKPY